MKRTLTGCALATTLLAAALEAAAQDPSDAVFNENTVATYRITMAAADWSAIVNDPFGSGDQWKRCSVQWQSDAAVADVAVHAVGTNRTAGNPKPAIRLKFDEFVPSREWRGVDNIKLEGNITEAFSERVAYWTHNQFGVEAPRAAHARLFVNGADKGVYCAVEPVRKKFVKYHFGIANFDGNVYKIDRLVNGVRMTADQYRWINSNPASYVPAIWEPITNEVGGNYSDVVGLLDILNNLPQSQRRGALNNTLHLDEFFKYLAVLAATGDWDSIVANRSEGWVNNHYWVHRTDTNKLHVIPWDCSNGFGWTFPGTYSLNAVNRSIYGGIDPAASSFPVTKATGWIAPDAVARSTYEAKLLQLINGPFASVPGRIDFVYNQIRNSVYSDPLKGSLTNAQFDANVAGMKNWVPARISAIRSQLPAPVAATVTVTATDASASEPASPGTFTVSRTGSTSGSLTVTFTVGGTATNGTDYSSIGTSVTIAAGSASATVTVTPIDNTAVESNETVTLTLSSSPSYTVGSPSSATVTISDDDTAPTLPTVTIAATDANAAEPSSVGVFTVTRTGPTTAPLTVQRARSGTATSGTDFVALPSSITIPAGQASVTVTVTPVDDTGVEGSETVILTISPDPAYTVGTSSTATVTIADNDTAPTLPTVTIAATDPGAGEPSNPGTFTITRTGSTTASLTVVRARSGTATSGTDFAALPSPITIPAGQASVAVAVTPIDDTAVEGSETVILTISPDAAYTVGTPSTATVTIADNDTAPTLPTVTVSATDAAAAEPSNTGTFTVTRSGSTTAALTVNFTVGGTAASGTDYASIGTSVTIGAGSTTATKTVTPIDDTTVESSETVVLTLSSNAAYTVGTASSATVTIADNDTAPTLPTVTIAATDPGAGEPSNPGTFTITRTGSTTASLTVVRARSGTATSGTDFAALPSPITIPAGQASVTVTVTPIDDTAVEGSETVILTISPDAAYTVGTPSTATVTIADDDTSTGSGLSATYYDNSDFTGASVTRTDPRVDFNWGAGSPAPAIGPDTFSARWTGRVKANFSELYTVYTFTNDGVRLWVEGELLVDQWVQQSGGVEWSGQVALQAGRWYTIQMDYYENTGNGLAQLLWSSPSTPKEVIPQSQLDPALGPPDSRDNDGDGIPNDTDPDDDNDGIPDLQDPDRDGDGVTSVIEVGAGTDPNDGTSFPAGPPGGAQPAGGGDNGDGWINDRCAGGSIPAHGSGRWMDAVVLLAAFFVARRRRAP